VRIAVARWVELLVEAQSAPVALGLRARSLPEARWPVELVADAPLARAAQLPPAEARRSEALDVAVA